MPAIQWTLPRCCSSSWRAFAKLWKSRWSKFARPARFRARAAGEEILTWCIESGGSITGEHGVGMEKNELMAKLFSPETLDTVRSLKLLFDPDGRLNPGKVLPTGRGCLEIRQAPLEAGAP